jgi:predicted RNA-binding protein with PUA-like domain
LLNPRWQDLEASFEREFRGMTTDDVSLKELGEVREVMLVALRGGLTENERAFLLSLKSGEPQWELLGIAKVEQLPGVQWKLANIRKMPAAKRKTELERLQRILDS